MFKTLQQVLMSHFVLSVALLFTVPCFAQDAPQKDKIANLIEQLGDDEYESREAAHTELESIGKPALAALRKAADDKDIERASRAEELVEKISGKRVDRNKDEPIPQPRTPPNSPIPDLPVPDLQELLRGFDEDQFPQELQGILEMFKNLMDKNGSGTLDPQNLFEKLFGNKAPNIPEPIPVPVVSKIEQELGIKVVPLPEALRVHLNIPANQGLLVVDATKSNKCFQKHDVLNRINKNPAPSKKSDWGTWSKTATHISNIKQLELLRDAPCSIELVRKGGAAIRDIQKIVVPESDF